MQAPPLHWLEMAARSIGTAENRLRDKFHYLQFGSNTIPYFMQI